MTKSGEISSAKGSIVSVLNDVKSTFDGITGDGKWQGDSMEGLKQKVQTFVSEATSVLQSKLEVLANFAQKYEEFEALSKECVPLRTERHKHCKVGHTCANGCCCPPTYDESGAQVCAWRESGCFTGPRDQVKQKVQQMNQKHNEGASIKSGFPSSKVPAGQGIEPFYDY